MVTLSALLHVLVGLALFHVHHTQGSEELASGKPVSTVVLLQTEEAPDLNQTDLTNYAIDTETVNPSSFSVLINSPYRRKMQMAARAAALLAKEANPNAHARPPSLDAVLSPASAPHLNSANGVVFLLDISGSMYETEAGVTRLDIARADLAQRIRALPNGTPFAITVYALVARNSGPLVEANDATREAAARWIMNDFNCGGGTNLPEGFSSAEQLEPGHLVLFTDGDLNIRVQSLLAFAHQILGPIGQCPGLSVVAINPRPATDAVQLLRALSNQQGGTYQEESAASAAALLTSNKPPVAAP